METGGLVLCGEAIGSFGRNFRIFIQNLIFSLTILLLEPTPVAHPISPGGILPLSSASSHTHSGVSVFVCGVIHNSSSIDTTPTHHTTTRVDIMQISCYSAESEEREEKVIIDSTNSISNVSDTASVTHRPTVVNGAGAKKKEEHNIQVKKPLSKDK